MIRENNGLISKWQKFENQSQESAELEKINLQLKNENEILKREIEILSGGKKIDEKAVLIVIKKFMNSKKYLELRKYTVKNLSELMSKNKELQ